MIVQGRKITTADIDFIRRLIEQNPSWKRTRLSKELCTIWDWRSPNGQVKDMSCRCLLLKLQKLDYITLPPPIHSGNNSIRNRSIEHVFHSTSPIEAILKNLTPIRILHVQNANDQALFNCLLSRYHYLAYRGTAGQNIKYLVFDHQDVYLYPLTKHFRRELTRDS